jgi:hypothetical protein
VAATPFAAWADGEPLVQVMARDRRTEAGRASLMDARRRCAEAMLRLPDPPRSIERARRPTRSSW